MENHSSDSVRRRRTLVRRNSGDRRRHPRHLRQYGFNLPRTPYSGLRRTKYRGRFSPSEDDNLVGSPENDVLLGQTGDDTLTGTDAATAGQGEIDILVGGGGEDTFVLGDASTVFYNDGRDRTPGTSDYAIVADFNLEYDTIQLHGTAEDYSLGEVPGDSPISGTVIYKNSPPDSVTPEAIGILAGVEVSSFSQGFTFVG
ncbi:hypothetical protein [Baaleninema simplex]|uniref:hypothetical protein n=1 Tax=Baaleninema simplex TaxID=2862350 RepID=UPI00036E3733